MIVDLDELNIGELFEVRHQRTGNGVQRAVGLAGAAEVNMRDAIGIFEPGVPGKTVGHDGKSLIAFDTGGTLEVFVENGADDIPR